MGLYPAPPRGARALSGRAGFKRVQKPASRCHRIDLGLGGGRQGTIGLAQGGQALDLVFEHTLAVIMAQRLEAKGLLAQGKGDLMHLKPQAAPRLMMGFEAPASTAITGLPL